MTNEEIYDFIGELAIALYSKKVQISLGALRAIMLDKGKDYVNNRGMASAVSAAYRRWKEKDPIIYYAIAYTYTDKEGNLAWDDPKKAEKPAEKTSEEKAEEMDLFSEEAEQPTASETVEDVPAESAEVKAPEEEKSEAEEAPATPKTKKTEEAPTAPKAKKAEEAPKAPKKKAGDAKKAPQKKKTAQKTK